MAWAIAGAVAVTPIAVQAIERWDQALAVRWTHTYRRIVARRQWTCRLVAAALRRPMLMRGIVAMLARRPELARPLVSAIQHRSEKGLVT
jgi:hypothetical protein